MRYFGGKARTAKYITEFLLNNISKDRYFIDLFCGSCNITSKISSKHGLVMANDVHRELICMWKEAVNGREFPINVSEEDFNNARSSNDSALKAFIGFGGSFAGIYFSGYARGGGRNYFREAKDGIAKKIKTMSNVIFSNKSYQDVNLPANSVIYCDIPYKNAVGYTQGSFNHEEFYAWCVDKRSEGHDIFVSEYKQNLPDGWIVLWEKESRKSVRNKDGEQETTIEIIMTPLLGDNTW
jgi:DNA adenine methylase